MSKVLNDHLTDLRLDLKDSGAIWSDAELERCLERAVADLTRFLPREMSAEFIIDATVTAESFTSPAASDPDYFVTTWDISDPLVVKDGSTATLAARIPDVPRPVMITVTDASVSITDLVIIIKGRDVDGNYMEEYYYLAGGLVQTGEKYLATVTEVEIHKITGNVVAATITMTVGTGTHEGVYVQLANKPIKFQSDAISGRTRYTDYTMDYRGGRVALKSGGGMSAATAYSINYTKNKITLDISSLKDFIRVERVEYPEGSVPQDLSTMEMWGSFLTLTSSGIETQAEASDDEHVLVHYFAEHQPPGNSSPGTYPAFLDWTVELAASAYALFIEALEHELQAVTDIASVRTALTNVTKYLNDNSGEDAAGLLLDITTDAAELRTKVRVAADAVATYLGAVSTTDLDAATVGAVAWLLEGELTIDKLNDGENVPALFSEYAKTKVQIAQSRIQAAVGYAQELTGRLSDARLYLEQAGAHNRIAEVFAAEAAQYQETAANEMILAERLRAEAIERRNEAWAIWSSAPQYSPQYALGQRSQN